MEFVSNRNFILEEIPRFIPDSLSYIEFWKEQKRRCIEGYWSGGKWMPGPVYFYVNFATIEIKESKYSKNPTKARPFLRDLEWEKGYMYMEAKGFSGFELDTEFTCDRMYDPKVYAENLEMGLIEADTRTYINARDYLRKIHPRNLGKPLFRNNASNIVDIESRGSGKSFTAAGFIAHNFLFDGANDYDVYLEKRKQEKYESSETLIGAIESKFTNPLISKVMLTIDSLPGSQEYNKKAYNSPLYSEYSGSLTSGKQFIDANREVKVGNNWVSKGSRSKIYHRTFLDDPTAGNGLRPNLICLEEVGFFGNLLPSLGSLRDTTMNGDSKFGVIWMFGTGGDMSGGSTEAVKEVFYNPVDNECLFFEDEWENKGKIGYFVPYHRTLNSYRDEEGNLDIEKAKFITAKERESVKNNQKKLMKLMENRPEKPSEAFITSDMNMFPIKDLREIQSRIETTPSILAGVWTGTLVINERGKVEYSVKHEYPPTYDYPIRDNKLHKGCIVIYEHPYKEQPEKGFYIAGMDTYDDDGSDTDSLGAIYIMNRLTERIVAQYVGRPDTAEEFYEICRRLLIFYNAVCNYENNKKGFFGYMDSKNQIHYLCDTPRYLAEVENTTFHESGNKSKGTNATMEVNKHGRRLQKGWLLKKAYSGETEEILNLHQLKDLGLIKEYCLWHAKANADRISAMGMLMILLEDRRKYEVSIDDEQDKDEVKEPDFFERHFTENSYIKILDRRY